MSSEGAGEGSGASLSDEYEYNITAEEAAAMDAADDVVGLPYGYTGLTGGAYGTEGYRADRWEGPGGREEYWEGRRGEPGALPGALPWDFYTDPDNLRDLGRGLMSLAMPMGAKLAMGLLKGELPSPDKDQTPAPTDVPGGFGVGMSGPRMTRVAAPAPQTAAAAGVPASGTSDQPKRAATGTPSAGIMANIRTTPYGLLSDAPVARKILLGT